MRAAKLKFTVAQSTSMGLARVNKVFARAKIYTFTCVGVPSRGVAVASSREAAAVMAKSVTTALDLDSHRTGRAPLLL
jgi:hypothetical protein